MKLRHLALSLIAAGALLASIAGCGAANEAPQPTPDADVTPPADSIGERIFLDTVNGDHPAAVFLPLTPTSVSQAISKSGCGLGRYLARDLPGSRSGSLL